MAALAAAMIEVATTDLACRVVLNTTDIRGDTAEVTVITLPRQPLTFLHHQEPLDSGLECHHRHHQTAITASHMTTDTEALQVTTNTGALLTQLMAPLGTMAMATLPTREDKAQEATIPEAVIKTVGHIGS